MKTIGDVLLSFGGMVVIQRSWEAGYDDLLVQRGRLAEPGKVAMLKGHPEHCRRDTSAHYLLRHPAYRIATGYALSDAAWVRHSWLLSSDTITEPAVPRRLYFGVTLDDTEAARFVMAAAYDFSVMLRGDGPPMPAFVPPSGPEALSAGQTLTLAVHHTVAEDYRAAQARLGRGVPLRATTTFLAPPPEVVWPFARLRDDGIVADLHLDGGDHSPRVVREAQIRALGETFVRYDRVAGLRLAAAAPRATMEEVVAALRRACLSPEQEAHNARVDPLIQAARKEEARVWRECEQDAAEQRRLFIEAARLGDEDERVRWEAERARATQRLRAWAEVNGGFFLKKRLPEGYDWEAMAREEYVNAAVAPLGLARADPPDGFRDGTALQAVSPALAQIEVLRAVRGKLPVGCRAEMRLVRYESTGDKPRRKSRHEIEVRVTAPDGQDSVRYFLPRLARGRRQEG